MPESTVRRLDQFPHELAYEGTTDIWTLDGSDLDAGVSYVKVRKGASLRPHYHDNPTVLIYVAKGSGYLNTGGGQEKPVKEGDIISIPKGAVHGFRTAEEELEFLSIQTPRIYLEGTGKDTHFV